MDDTSLNQTNNKYAGARVSDEIGPFDISVFFLNARLKAAFSERFCSLYDRQYGGDISKKILKELKIVRQQLQHGFEYVEEITDCADFDNITSFAEKRKEQLIFYLDSIINNISHNKNNYPPKYSFYMICNFYFFAKRGEDVKVTWLPTDDILLSQSIYAQEITVYPTLAEEILTHGGDNNIVLQRIDEWNEADYREDLKSAPIGQTQEIDEDNLSPYIKHDIFFNNQNEKSRLSDLVHFNRGVFQTPVTYNGEIIGFLFICSPIDFENLFESNDKCKELFNNTANSVISSGLDKLYAEIKNKYEESVYLIEGYHRDPHINSAIDVFDEIKFKSDKLYGGDMHQFLKTDKAKQIVSEWLITEDRIAGASFKKSITSLFLYDDESHRDEYESGRRIDVNLFRTIFDRIGLGNVNVHLSSERAIFVPNTPFLTFFLSLRNFIYSLTSEDRPDPRRLDFHHVTCQMSGGKNMEKYYLEINLSRIDDEEDDEWGLAKDYYGKYARMMNDRELDESVSKKGNVVRSLNNLLYCGLGTTFFNPRQDSDQHIRFLSRGFERQVINVSFPSTRCVVLSWQICP